MAIVETVTLIHSTGDKVIVNRGSDDENRLRDNGWVGENEKPKKATPKAKAKAKKVEAKK